MRVRVYLLALAAFLALGTTVKSGPGTDGRVEFLLVGSIADSDTTLTAVAPAAHSPCQQSAGDVTDAIGAQWACWVPVGWTWTIRAVTYSALTALSATEKCILSLSNDSGGVSSEAWSATDTGTGTTATCDYGTVSGAFDGAGETCRQTSPTGLVAVANTPVYLMVAEESVGNCDSLVSISYGFEVVATRVAVP